MACSTGDLYLYLYFTTPRSAFAFQLRYLKQSRNYTKTANFLITVNESIVVLRTANCRYNKASGVDWRKNKKCHQAVLYRGALGIASTTPVSRWPTGWNPLVCQYESRDAAERTAAWNQNSYRGRHPHRFYSFLFLQLSDQLYAN